ncbi:MAG: methionyl-tRNA formyltransferase [Desulfobacterales bacterium]|nr:methionyl-tRNA formyltransferase [Desulfobacterales bacterium]
MGTPDFSVPSLNALHENGYDVCLVVTQPDRPKGRGRKMRPPPVKDAATRLGIDVVQPQSIHTGVFEERIEALAPDFFVVAAYGHFLSERLLAVPRLGPINVHASLLPRYRGAAPIQWSVINNEKETGITTMRMNKGIDTGDILLSAKENILPDDTSSTLHDRLAVLGASLLIKTLEGLEAGSIHPVPQIHDQATDAPFLKKSDGKINWDLPVEMLDAFVRGMSPWPGAFTFFENKRVKIFKVAPAAPDDRMPPGTVIKGFPDELRVAVKDGAVSILEIQGASGKRLLIRDFLRGCKVPSGTVLF